MQRRRERAIALLALVALLASIFSSLRWWSPYKYYPLGELQSDGGRGGSGGGDQAGPRYASTLRSSDGDDFEARRRREDDTGDNGGRATYPRVLRLLRRGGVGRVVSVPSSHTYRRIVDEGIVDHPNITDDYFDRRQLHYMEGREKHEPGVDVCMPLGDWQLALHPTCLAVHEISLVRDVADGRSFIAGAGGIRYAWKVEDYNGKELALKNLQMDRLSHKEFHTRLHRDRIDAIALAELSKSSLVVDVYGHCANAALYDFAGSGRLGDVFDDAPNLTKSVLLEIALNASKALADAHHYDESGRPTIVHGDLNAGQFVLQGGYYKLNDFNNAKLLKWNVTSNDATCMIRGENVESRDVGRLAKVLYFILVGGKAHGKQPKIPDEIRNGRHRFNVCLTRAIDTCYADDPDKRPSARQVAIALEACSKENK